MKLILPVLASLAFSPNTPQAERIEALSRHFSPAPGGEAQISESLPSGAPERKIKNLRGYIKIQPPKGTCLTVTRKPSESSEYICKDSVLSFKLSDIDRTGKFSWEVKTGKDDPGTTLTWQTPYRMIIVIPRKRGKLAISASSPEFWQDEPPEYKFIKSCADISNHTSRRLELRLFSGESWRFYFPDTHEMLPQPEEAPNLVIASNSQKRSLSDAAKEKKAEEMGEESLEEAKIKEAAEKNRPDNLEDRKVWTISLRDSFEMSADNFHPDGTTTPGSFGICRYNFSGPEDDPTTGRVECQNTGNFHMVLVPVTCIGSVAGDKVLR